MADQREGGIAWTDETWNPTRGCSRISPGCGGGTPGERKGGCYAERMAIRLSGPGQPYEGLVESTDDGPRWTGKLVLDREKLLQPLRWRTPRKVFVDSMSDLFHDALSDDDIDHVFSVMLACEAFEPAKGHVFQVLTKRAARMRVYFAAGAEVLLERWAKAGDGWIIVGDGDIWFSEYIGSRTAHDWRSDGTAPRGEIARPFWHPGPLWPLSNTWLGVSVETQKYADLRVPHLAQTPAAVRWVSYEPALGPVDWRSIPCPGQDGAALAALDWIVAGEEAGPGNRKSPDFEDWMRMTRDQCSEAGVAFLYKQRADDRGRKTQLPLLDGRQWAQYPAVMR